jgi:hypothetical protein
MSGVRHVQKFMMNMFVKTSSRHIMTIMNMIVTMMIKNDVDSDHYVMMKIRMMMIMIMMAMTMMMMMTSDI